MAYRLRFGSFDFPATLMPARIDSPGDIADQERPRADGATQQVLRRKARMLSVEGSIAGTSADAIQSALDSLKQAVFGSGIQPLWFGRDDRFINAQCESFTDDFGGGSFYGNLVNVSMGFKAGDPYFYATSTTTVTLATNGQTVTNSGEASALTVWTLTVGAAGTGPITLSNTTTGETAIVAGPFGAGDVIVLDRTAYSVTVDGLSVFGQLVGRIPLLVSGGNAIGIVSTGTATVSAAMCEFVERWY